MSLILLHGAGILYGWSENSVKDKKTHCQLPDLSLRALSFSREFVKIATLQDSSALQRCLASLYYFLMKSGVNKEEGVQHDVIKLPGYRNERVIRTDRDK